MSKINWTMLEESALRTRLNNKLTALGPKMQGYLNTVVFDQYRRAQIERWKTGGTGATDTVTSEGDKWKALKPGYLKYKRKAFASMDYSGNQILVATGRLLRSVIGPTDQKKVVTPKSLYITTTVPYAKDVSDVRPFSKFGKETRKKISDGIKHFVVQNAI